MCFHNFIELLLESTCFLFEGNTIQHVIKQTAYSANGTKCLQLLCTYHTVCAEVNGKFKRKKLIVGSMQMCHFPLHEVKESACLPEVRC